MTRVPSRPRPTPLYPIFCLCAGLLLSLTLTPGLASAQGSPVLEAPGIEEPQETDAAPPEAAPTDLDGAGKPTDAEIERRLESTFAQFEELGGLEVEVRSGVARLRGEVLRSSDAELARRLAEGHQGILFVDDRVEEVRDVGRRMGPVLERLRERLQELLVSLPLVGVAVLVFGLFVLLARWLSRLQPRVLQRLDNPFLRELVHQGIRLAVLLVGALLALDLLDATALVGAVLGTAGVVGLALGFAFRDTAENYIASILLSLRQPFAPNDVIQIEGHEGKVVRLTSRATILMTLDGNHLRIPNAVVFKSVMLNYSQLPERRFDFTVGVGTEEDLSEALRVGLETLREMPGILEEPPPWVLVEALGDSAVQVHCYAWVDQRETSLIKAQSEAIRRVKEAYDRAGIAMPEPIYQIRRLEPAAESPGAETPVAASPVDLQPDVHIDRQVEADRAASEETDLLREDAPRE